MAEPVDGKRRHLAGDDWVTRFGPGQRYGLRIDSSRPKAGWTPRRPGDARTAEHPGTALLFEDRLWEIVLYGRTDRAPIRHVYYLAAWPETQVPRSAVDYSAAIAEEHVATARRNQRDEGAAHGLRLLLPLLGLLPADDQRRLENELGLPARWMSALSAALLLAFSTIVGLWTVWAARSPETPAALAPWVPWIRNGVLFLWAESAVRLAFTFSSDDPIGAALVAGPIHLMRSLRGALQPERRRRRSRLSERRRALLEQLMAERDRVLPLPGRPARLEIRSVLDKPHWVLGRTGIGWDGRWWQLVEREELGDDAGERPHRFVLEELEPGSNLPAWCEYRPTEVRRLWADDLRRQRSSAVETLAPLWGMLDRDSKLRLAAIYGWDAERWNRWSIPVAALLALPMLLVSLGALLERDAGVLDLLALLASAGLVGDSLWRWPRREQLRGSFLSPLLRRLARPLLETPSSAEVEAAEADG